MVVTIEDANRIICPDYFQPRQWDVLKLKLLGYSGSQMARELGLAEHTVYDRSTEVRQILGITDGQKELMQWAIENGLITINF